MQGGKRVNAGRKSVSLKEKKVGFKVYLTPELQEEINYYGVGASFSEKCANLIAKRIQEEKESFDSTIRFIDLFAGLGGIRLGFEEGLREVGLEAKCVFSSEIKKYAIKAYQGYFGNEKVYGDITQIETDTIPDFDFLLAGFPCQPFSSAGKGLGFADTRGTMFFEIERILKEKMDAGKAAKGFLLENVEGLVNHDGGNTLAVIVDHLQKLGYNVNYKLIDSVIISSQIFCPYSLGFFPIIIALYEKNEKGINYDFIKNYNFKTIDDKIFCLNDFDFISKYIDKYPNKNRVSDKVAMFYTMRDINALRRSKTFIKKDCANAVYVPKSKYRLYCYVDVFKQNIKTVPYYFGNCDIMIDYNKFKILEKDFIKASKSKILNSKILDYFENLLGEHYAN